MITISLKVFTSSDSYNDNGCQLAYIGCLHFALTIVLYAILRASIGYVVSSVGPTDQPTILCEYRSVISER